ncbi:hypothetical protein [Rahnella sp. GSA61A]|uniref:hypothetical protein n=1 Tax=Rahnella sp. GSA61A TaxID=2862678 RepID=UPI001CBDCB9D|nr:hypothetical protein [Rahnella sp. GSA61A]
MTIKHLICIVLNWSFLLHISCDKNFDTPLKNALIRISLFHVCIGISHYYFLTYDFETNKFSLYYKLFYRDLCSEYTQTDISNEVDNYKNTLLPTKSELHDIQVEFLKEKKEDNKEAISSSYNKASFLLGFITTVAGLLVYLLPIIVSYNSSSIFVYIFILYFSISSISNIINAGVFIFEVLRVRGYHQYRYEDISKAKGENYVLLYQYFEWKAISNARVYKVGLLRNAEKYSIRVFFLAITLWIFLQLFPSSRQEENKTQEIPVYKSDSSIKNRGKYETVFI